MSDADDAEAEPERRPPRVVLVVGPCGAGKTSALRRLHAVLAGRIREVAVLETDTVWMMIDPTWSYTARREAICTRVTAAAAAQFVEEGCDWVVVGSNGLQDRRQVNEFIDRLPHEAEVFHLFLDPSTTAVQARIARRADPMDEHKTPQWVAENVAWMRTYHQPESAVIDNSELSVDETVDAIYAAVTAGFGLIRAPGLS